MADELKRYAVKTIRDGAKSAYQKDDRCIICHTEEHLQLHHYTGLADLWTLWCRKNQIKVYSTEDVLEVREQFILQHYDELYHDVVTLCKQHHSDLHQLFGKAPAIGSAKAQAKWIEVQRRRWLEKHS